VAVVSGCVIGSVLVKEGMVLYETSGARSQTCRQGVIQLNVAPWLIRSPLPLSWARWQQTSTTENNKLCVINGFCARLFHLFQGRLFDAEQQNKVDFATFFGQPRVTAQTASTQTVHF
jgi:hypothetical protein